MSYTLPSTCAKHNSMPIQIYNQCVACEVQMYKDEADKYKKALEEVRQKAKRNCAKSNFYIRKIIDEALNETK